MKPQGCLSRCLLALALTMLSLQAAAETQRGRDFDHTTIGFKLYGGHATAACERCHVDEIFKGTPKNCDGCHALGKYLLKPAALKPAALKPAALTPAALTPAGLTPAGLTPAGLTPAGLTPAALAAAPETGSDMAAAQAAEKPDTQGPDKNHMATGFPLLGGHATAACATCHVDGIFKGTPKKCDDCHSVGKRIVATPKSSGHIVTDAQCDSCHFNTSTWLGARFNHGAARPGQCATCHNGRVAAGKHSSHVATTLPCDQCHRSSSWLPASWNHTGTQYAAQDCSACHKVGGPGRNLSSAHLPMSMPPVNFVGNCKACHTNYYNFYSAYYDHVAAPQTCQTCHGTYNAPVYTNVASPIASIHGVLPSLPVAVTCISCHRTFGSFSAAKFDHIGASQCSTCHSGAYTGIQGKSPGHVAYSATATECSACHTTTTSWSSIRGQALHAYLVSPSYPHTPTCRSCHSGDSHDGKDGAVATMDCSMGGCHKPAGGRGTLYLDWEH